MEIFIPMKYHLLKNLYEHGFIEELAINGYIKWLVENKPKTIEVLAVKKEFRHWLAQNGYAKKLKKLGYKCWLLKWGYISAPKGSPLESVIHPNRWGDIKLSKLILPQLLI